ncbi:hypothetical protein GCM10010911_29850 [Paenibacillus nasutitermitis]|uniref:Uncharacterized protein n=1 Tax=Paenibacillus nasutitermitis TaxID=1652958 RepID=A0A917DV14_9BACL|nr:hypothetical protein GCM10010911_29850 [Paenibacillus nasutitermitis]
MHREIPKKAEYRFVYYLMDPMGSFPGSQGSSFFCIFGRAPFADGYFFVKLEKTKQAFVISAKRKYTRQRE